MNDTWVKLYRKINMNAIMRDCVALQLWVWIITNADKETGQVNFNRYPVARELDVNPNTLYSALQRLICVYKTVNSSSTTKGTTISVINWAKYQVGKTENNVSSTSHQQAVNNAIYTRIKNKETRNIIIKATDVAGGPELPSLNDLLGLFKEINPEYEKFFANKTERKAMAEMVDRYGFEKVDNLLKQLPSIVTRPYAPSISSPSQLQKKMGLLLQFLAKNEIATQSKSAVFKTKS